MTSQGDIRVTSTRKASISSCAHMLPPSHSKLRTIRTLRTLHTLHTFRTTLIRTDGASGAGYRPPSSRGSTGLRHLGSVLYVLLAAKIRTN